MDREKMKILVSILMDSPLYATMAHEERMSLLLSLANNYPSLFTSEEQENNCGRSRSVHTA